MHAEKPIFIVAAPRSGSTLLFETLMRHRDIWSFGDEGHGWIEKYPQLRPLRGGVPSNRLTEENLTGELKDLLMADMLAGLFKFDGSKAGSEAGAIRLVEKTPKNCLRIPFIDAIYPDALYVYLYRDPRENIASIMEGWRHQRFVTYGDVRTRHGMWCFLRPPNWQQVIDRPLEQIAAFQWQSCHEIMLDDLDRIDSDRWISCGFAEFLEDPQRVVKELVSFCGLNTDPALEDYCARPLPPSRSPHTAPAADKWQQHYEAIASVMPVLEKTVERINRVAARPGRELQAGMPEKASVKLESRQKTGRNEKCPCGSGRKYKHCHGRMD